MQYNRVQLQALGYELPPVVVTSDEIEAQLAPVYEKLRIGPGQLQALTGIRERRWWEEAYPLSDGAAAAGRKAMQKAGITGDEVEVLIYAGVCREQFEPATACAVANQLGVSNDAYVYDISNACLGVLNGIIDIANRIELGQIRAGMVVSCESAREINEVTLQRLLDNPTMTMFSQSLATFTGGSGAAAVLLTDGSFGGEHPRRLLAAATKAAPEHHRLCRWGISPAAIGEFLFSPEKMRQALKQVTDPTVVPGTLRELMSHKALPTAVTQLMPREALPAAVGQVMTTDSVNVLKHGCELGVRTWESFLNKIGWNRDQVDKVICHQVGSGHRDTILNRLGIDPAKDFSTFPYLGNIGTVSVPLTAALADQRRFLKPGDRVGFLGIGSGLNCLMLGWQW